VADDLPPLSELYRRSSLSNDGDRANLLGHPDELVFSDRAVTERRVRIATVADRIAGFATVADHDQIGELEDLFVDPDAMLRGAGRALVLDAVAGARARGLTRIDVTANPHALGFYEKVGFVSDGITETQFGPGHRMHLDVR
jgi:GNAT superfamily N-acetyltransferase